MHGRIFFEKETTGVILSINLPIDIWKKQKTFQEKIKFTFLPVYGGNWNNGTLYNATTNGNWWSSTANNEYNRWNLNYNNGSLNTNNNNRNNGNYVRCVRAS
ncbi:MAG: hypothetical protein Q4B34_02665 [Candidatus Saccharibacteria bacterium]|nr:hypothetical protein [Candidatus Saccharibacteria bacterium]